MTPPRLSPRSAPLSLRAPLALTALQLITVTSISLCSAQGATQGSPEPNDPLVARLSVPSGELEITRATLTAWRALTERLLKAQGLERPSDQVLERELKELALALHYARSVELSSLSPEAQREVMRARDQALVWSYLSEVHEQELTTETIPRRYVDLAIRQNIKLFRHPPLKRGVHLLIHTAYELSASTQPPVFTPEDQLKVSSAAERIHQAILLDPPAEGAALEQRLKRYQALLPEGYVLRFEDLGVFPQEGRFVRPFSDACFALKEGEQLTPPTLTRFGVHIAWIDEHIPAKDTPQEELEAEVRKRILNEVRGLRLNELISEARAAQVWVDEAYFLNHEPSTPSESRP